MPEPFVPGLEDLQDEEDYNDDIGGGGISSDEEVGVWGGPQWGLGRS